MRPSVALLSLGLLAALPAAGPAKVQYDRPINIITSDYDLVDTTYIDRGRLNGVKVGDKFEVRFPDGKVATQVMVTGVFERMASVKVVDSWLLKNGQLANFGQRPMITALEKNSRRPAPDITVSAKSAKPKAAAAGAPASATPAAPSAPAAAPDMPPAAPGGEPGLPAAPGAAPDAGLPAAPGAAPDAGLPPAPGAAPDAGLPAAPGAAPDAGLPPAPGAAPDAGLPAAPGAPAAAPDAGLPPAPGDPGLPAAPGGDPAGVPPPPM